MTGDWPVAGIKLPPDVYEALKAAGERRSMTVSAFGREIITAWLKDHALYVQGTESEPSRPIKLEGNSWAMRRLRGFQP